MVSQITFFHGSLSSFQAFGCFRSTLQASLRRVQALVEAEAYDTLGLGGPRVVCRQRMVRGHVFQSDLDAWMHRLHELLNSPQFSSHSTNRDSVESPKNPSKQGSSTNQSGAVPLDWMYFSELFQPKGGDSVESLLILHPELRKYAAEFVTNRLAQWMDHVEPAEVDRETLCFITSVLDTFACGWSVEQIQIEKKSTLPGSRPVSGPDTHDIRSVERMASLRSNFEMGTGDDATYPSSHPNQKNTASFSDLNAQWNRLPLMDGRASFATDSSCQTLVPFSEHIQLYESMLEMLMLRFEDIKGTDPFEGPRDTECSDCETTAFVHDMKGKLLLRNGDRPVLENRNKACVDFDNQKQNANASWNNEDKKIPAQFVHNDRRSIIILMCILEPMRWDMRLEPCNGKEQGIGGKRKRRKTGLASVRRSPLMVIAAVLAFLRIELSYSCDCEIDLTEPMLTRILRQVSSLSEYWRLEGNTRGNQSLEKISSDIRNLLEIGENHKYLTGASSALWQTIATCLLQGLSFELECLLAGNVSKLATESFTSREWLLTAAESIFSAANHLLYASERFVANIDCIEFPSRVDVDGRLDCPPVIAGKELPFVRTLEEITGWIAHFLLNHEPLHLESGTELSPTASQESVTPSISSTGQVGSSTGTAKVIRNDHTSSNEEVTVQKTAAILLRIAQDRGMEKVVPVARQVFTQHYALWERVIGAIANEKRMKDEVVTSVSFRYKIIHELLRRADRWWGRESPIPRPQTANAFQVDRLPDFSSLEGTVTHSTIRVYLGQYLNASSVAQHSHDIPLPVHHGSVRLPDLAALTHGLFRSLIKAALDFRAGQHGWSLAETHFQSLTNPLELFPIYSTGHDVDPESLPQACQPIMRAVDEFSEWLPPCEVEAAAQECLFMILSCDADSKQDDVCVEYGGRALLAALRTLLQRDALCPSRGDGPQQQALLPLSEQSNSSYHIFSESVVEHLFCGCNPNSQRIHTHNGRSIPIWLWNRRAVRIIELLVPVLVDESDGMKHQKMGPELCSTTTVCSVPIDTSILCDRLFWLYERTRSAQPSTGERIGQATFETSFLSRVRSVLVRLCSSDTDQEADDTPLSSTAFFSSTFDEKLPQAGAELWHESEQLSNRMTVRALQSQKKQTGYGRDESQQLMTRARILKWEIVSWICHGESIEGRYLVSSNSSKNTYRSYLRRILGCHATGIPLTHVAAILIEQCSSILGKGEMASLPALPASLVMECAIWLSSLDHRQKAVSCFLKQLETSTNWNLDGKQSQSSTAQRPSGISNQAPRVTWLVHQIYRYLLSLVTTDVPFNWEPFLNLEGSTEVNGMDAARELAMKIVKQWPCALRISRDDRDSIMEIVMKLLHPTYTFCMGTNKTVLNE